MRARLAIGMLTTCALMACEASPDVRDENPANPDTNAREETGDENTATVSSAMAEGCDYGAQGRAMDRYTRMCQGWGYDQGIFSYSGCSITLDYCIHW